MDVKSWTASNRPLVVTTAARSYVGEVPLDEPARRGLHESRARQVRVHIVEDDQVQPALQAACIGRHIGLNRLKTGTGRRKALNGELNKRKPGHLLGPAIFENLKIVLG